jgi:hypothetical protein
MGCGWEKKYKQTKWDKMADAQRIARNQEAYETIMSFSVSNTIAFSMSPTTIRSP